MAPEPIVGATVIVTVQNYFAGFGAWVTVIEGVIFVVSVLLFREGIIGVLKPTEETEIVKVREAVAPLPSVTVKVRAV